MSWINNIPKSFNESDKFFGSHASQCENAANMLFEASKEGVGLTNYLKEIEQWLRSVSCSEPHIKTQMEKVSDIASYLKHD